MFGFRKRRTDTLWLDLPDAKKRIRRKKKSIGAAHAQALTDLVEIGFTVLPGAANPKLCDQAAADYVDYLAANRNYADGYVDGLGRHNRLVNFHLTSQAAMALGSSPVLMDFLDLVFGKRAGIYTSLTFEYGTEQPIHRDSPFFHTFPMNYFVGAWVALEDISPEAGPLMYVPGGHRFFVDQHAIYHAVRGANPDLPQDEVIRLALENYYGVIITTSEKFGSHREAILKKGDIAIWHPALPHGGAPARDRSKTRRSIVFHCAPESMQVFQQDVFFAHHAAEPPPPRYPLLAHGDRRYAATGPTAFM